MTIYLAKIIRGFGYLFATGIILVAILVSVGRLLTPVLNHHRADFEAWASELVQAPVTIKEVHVSWRGYEPELSLNQVILLDAQTHKPKLEVQRLNIGFGLFRSLFSRKIYLDSIVVAGVDLTVNQLPSGAITVAGFKELAVTDKFTGGSVKATEIVSWIFTQPNLRLKDIDFRYHSNTGVKKLFTLKQLILSNAGASHVLEGEAILAQDVPTKAKISFNWNGNAMDFEHVSAHLYLYLEGVSLAQWFDQLSWHDLQIRQGLGSAKIWIDWDNNQWQKMQTHFQLYELVVQSKINQHLQTISRLNGNVGWKRDGNKYIIAGDQLLIDFSDHLWPVTSFYFSLVPDSVGNMTLENLRLGYVDLSESKKIISNLALLPTDIQEKINILDPSGDVTDFQAKFQGSFENLVSISTQFNALTFHPFQQNPGISNMTGNITWDGQEGNIKLNSQHVALDYHSIFESPLEFDNLTGFFHWKKDSEGRWLLQVKNIQASNKEVRGQGDMTITIPVNESPMVNLTADFSVMDASHITHYLPVQTFDSELVVWLKQAFPAGKIESGKAVFQGKLADFPFDNKQGIFLISGLVKDLNFRYAPDWPLIHHGMGELTFSGRSMTANINTGQILNVPITLVKGVIPNIGGDVSLLDVQGFVSSDLADGLQFIQKSPLQKSIGKHLTNVELSGAMQLKLGLTVPLKKPEDTKVIGDATITTANLRLPAWKFLLEQINGDVHFTEQDIQATALQAKLFGVPASLTITTQHPAKQPAFMQATLQSTIALSSVQTWLELPAFDFIKGAALFQIELLLPSSQITVRSDLKGIAIDLPAPYGKTADTVQNTQLVLTTGKDEVLRSQLSYGKLFTADIDFAHSPKGFELVDGELRAPTFNFLGQSFNQAQVQISQNKNQWVVNIDSKEAAGYVYLPLNGKIQNIQSIKAEFQHLYFYPINNAKNNNINPATLPSVSFVGNDVRYGKKQFGHVVLETARTPSGLAIKTLNLDAPLLNLHATGVWQLSNKQYKTQLQGDLKTNKLSDLLNEWGVDSANFIANKGSALFNLAWMGAPYEPTLSGMSGKITLNLGAGRIIDLSASTDTKIGIGRMLNVFNLNTLPRRLNLDFSDLSQKGFSFDVIKGDFILKNGSAITDNMRINGPIAGVSIRGRIGLAARDYDMRMDVTPYVTSSIPVMATIAGGPIVGAATWVVDKMVSREVSKVTTYHYDVIGSWDHPEWKPAASQ